MTNMANPTALVEAVVEGLAGDLLPTIDALAVDMAQQIHDGIPELPDALQSETVRTCRSHISNVFEMLLEGADPARAKAPADALTYAREVVRHGVPLESLMRKYRIGHAAFSRETLRLLDAHVNGQRELAEATSALVDWTFRYVDAVSASAMTAYMSERERWVRSAAAVRADEVRRILDGRSTDEARASQRLGYELGRPHVAFVCWSADGQLEDGVLRSLERLAQDAARVLGGRGVLSVPLGSAELAAWTAVESEPDVDALLSRLGVAAADAGAFIALGERHEGLTGFCRSYDEATRARRVAMLSRRSAGAPLRFRDSALMALLTAEPDEAERFVAQELGALNDPGDGVRRIAATLRVYFEEGGSFVRAARRLGVHENTVVYRVRRAEQLLGRPVTERQVETRVALQLAEALRRAAAGG